MYGEIMAIGRELLYMKYGIALESGDELKVADYDELGNIYNEKGEKTVQTIVLESLGKPLVKDGKLVIKDEDGNEVSDHNYLVSNNYGLILHFHLHLLLLTTLWQQMIF